MMNLQKLLSSCAYILMAAALCLSCLPQLAQAAGEEDLTFALNPDGESYTVASCDDSATGRLRIPALYQGKPVTGVGDHAFRNCKNLTGITLPESVSSLGEYVFAGCLELTGIHVEEGNPHYRSDPYGVLYDANQSELICAPAKLSGVYSIPGTVTGITSGAFLSCNDLTSVQIPEGVTGIGEAAFAACIRLRAVTIPEGVTEIGSLTFGWCTELTTVTIPASITHIGNQAFQGCGSLADVYYAGTEEQWARIHIDRENEPLTNAIAHFQEPNLFADVSETGWQYPFAKYAVERSLMTGKGTDAQGKILFDPNSPITREEFVQVLYNAEGTPGVTIENPFPDVKDNGWYKNAVLWAKEHNIANGGGDGRFGVGARITRQDLALMLYKYAALKGCDLQTEGGKINGFADGDKVATYAKTAMDWAVTKGILSGKGVTGQPLSTYRLDPTGTATRAECAAMLKNFLTAFGL